MAVIIGHTRFSLFHPNFEGWKASNGTYFETPDDYRKFLFSDARLKDRADIFLNHTIPTLAGAEKAATYRHVVSYSADLPQKYKDLLYVARDQYECIVLDEQRVPEDALDVADYARQFVDESGVFATFRIDDDDVLASNFFTQAERYLNPAFAGMKVTFGLGCTALYDNGEFRVLRSNYQPMNSIGLMSVNRWASDGSLVAPHITAHNMSDRFDPVILYSAEPSYLQVRHIGQDTNVGNKAWSASAEPIEAMMRKLERVSPAVDIKSLFPTIEDLAANIVDFGEQIDEPELLINPYKFDLKEKTRSITVRYRGSFAKKPEGEKACLVSFHLVDASGQPIAPTASIPGLIHSDHQLIDWFRYMGTSDKETNVTVKIELPEGVYCDSVSIMRWLETDNRFTLKSFSIEK